MKRPRKVRDLPLAGPVQSTDVSIISQINDDGEAETRQIPLPSFLAVVNQAVANARQFLVDEFAAKDVMLQQQVDAVNTALTNVENMGAGLQQSLVLLQQAIEDSSNQTPYDMWLDIPGNEGKTLQDYYDTFKGPAGTTSWAGITDKPLTFPPASHEHQIVDVVGLTTALNGKAATAHTHSVGDVTGLSDALAVKLESVNWTQVQGKPSEFAPAAHTQGIDTIAGLQTALDAKLSTVSWAQVMGKPTTFTPAAHTHTIADVANLQATLDAKGNTLLGQFTIAENILIALSSGVRKVNVSVPGTVVGGNYQVFAVNSTPTGYAILDAVCTAAGTLQVSLMLPALAIGASYSIPVRVVRINT